MCGKSSDPSLKESFEIFLFFGFFFHPHPLLVLPLLCLLLPSFVSLFLFSFLDSFFCLFLVFWFLVLDLRMVFFVWLCCLVVLFGCVEDCFSWNQHSFPPEYFQAHKTLKIRHKK